MIVPNPSPPPTSAPCPTENSLIVTVATHASSISLGPRLHSEKSASIRTSFFPRRSEYDAVGNTSWVLTKPSSAENRSNPRAIHFGASFRRGVHWGLASRCALTTTSQCRPWPFWFLRRSHRFFAPLQYQSRFAGNGMRGASIPTSIWCVPFKSFISSTASFLRSENHPE